MRARQQKLIQRPLERVEWCGVVAVMDEGIDPRNNGGGDGDGDGDENGCVGGRAVLFEDGSFQL